MGNSVYNQKLFNTLLRDHITDILTYDMIKIDIFSCDLIKIVILVFSVISYSSQYVDI